MKKDYKEWLFLLKDQLKKWMVKKKMVKNRKEILKNLMGSIVKDRNNQLIFLTFFFKLKRERKQKKQTKIAKQKKIWNLVGGIKDVWLMCWIILLFVWLIDWLECVDYFRR